MDWTDHFRIAWVHLRERKRQTVLTALGVAVGSAMLVTTISVAKGSSANVVRKVIDTVPNVVVKAERVRPLVPDLVVPSRPGRVSMVEKNVTPDREEVIKDYQGVLESVSAVPGLKGVSPFVESRLIARNRSRFTPCVTKGVVPSLEGGIAGLKKNLLEPDALDELAYTPDGILVGDLLAQKLRASHGDRIVLVNREGREFTAKVVGRFSSGFNAKDEREAFVNLALARRMESVAPNAVTGIGLSVGDVERASRTAAAVQEATGYRSESWDETNRNVIDFYNRNAAITLVLVGFVFIVAGLGVSSVMTTVVLQKVKDIAIMRSMGVQAESITWIFMLEGLMIGILGVLVGSPVGHVICHFVSSIRFAATTAGVLKADRINILETPEAHLMVIAFGIFVTVLSSLSPARKATSYMPVQVLRGEV
ncbi:FtsX-like permease family protein [Chlorobium sp. N1]|uniref:ABC transporter permease n=1 Tax=Chlorobium sp. N1 TaxID=2491138 RepID=UPI00103922DA|nr:FtsX-like permease family protein [Chlorobium sp. N1]TCD48728.1 ABC transporter permease [Chlorobium sp. N1]